MKTKPKPCVFCGSDNLKIRGNCFGFARMVCLNCGKQGPMVSLLKKNNKPRKIKAVETEVIKRWNSRKWGGNKGLKGND